MHCRWLLLCGALAGAPALSAQATLVAQRDTTLAGPAGILQPGDVLRLKIWMEPDWSGDFAIDEHGIAVLPRLGNTRVIDVPTDRLRQQLTEQYRQFLNNPSIEITPLRRVAIIGAVKNPGIYRIEPSVTLGEVVNVAGGQIPQAKRNVVELRHGSGHRTIDLQKHPELASLPLASDDQVYVPERSWLSQNATWFVSTLVGIAGTTAYLVTR
ncbi:MAG TPA: polysaccharide biosynthesis/export family protein [Gemmatimonadales bacterium]|jgi:polysaccharide export outer membrane protein